MPILETVQLAIRQHRLMASDARVVVAVSGGADSLALLHILHRLGYRLHVATLDHGARGAESAADAQFVADIAAAWGLPVTVGHLAGDDHSEAAMRSGRYAFLADVARQVGAVTMATGHHADDQAETLLLRLVRGTGLDGLAGMGWRAPVPGHPGLSVVRPLLGVTRAEIDTYCAAHNLKPRHDPTNDDTDYLRNRVRHDVLPLLETLNPNVRAALVRLADNAALDADYMAGALREALAGVVLEADGGRVSLARARFRAMPPALQRRTVLYLGRLVGGDGVEIGYERVTAALRLLLDGEQGAVVQLGGGVQARVDYDRVLFEREDAPPPRPRLALSPGTEQVFKVGEPVPLVGGRLLVARHLPDDFTPLAALHLPPGAALGLRTRQPGDRLALPGLQGRHKTLKAWMIDQKIPAGLRPQIPLLIVDGAVAIVLYRPALTVMLPWRNPQEGWEIHQLGWHNG